MLDKIVVVKKATPLDELLNRYTTTSQVKYFLESRGESYDYYKTSNDAYKNSLNLALAALPQAMRTQIVDKEHLGTFQFGDKDLVVVVGDPGLFVNVAKYVNSQPVITINPDTERIDNILFTCATNVFAATLAMTLAGEYKTEALTMGEAVLDDGQKLYALNDFFIGQATHVSARYFLEYAGQKERQSSSGIIISTGTGSTGWMTSVLTGAYKIAKNNEMPIDVPFSREANFLMFSVREPFATKVTGTNIVYGVITETVPLKINSNMPENGVIFSDGIQKDYIEFNSGATVTVAPSKKKVNLVV